MWNKKEKGGTAGRTHSAHTALTDLYALCTGFAFKANLSCTTGKASGAHTVEQKQDEIFHKNGKRGMFMRASCQVNVFQAPAVNALHHHPASQTRT